MIKLTINLFFYFYVISVCIAQDDVIKAGGVLPYAIKNDSIFILLGYDEDKPGWTDFGGGREWVASLNNPEKRLETPVELAVREFYEESRKVYSVSEIQSRLDSTLFLTASSQVYRSYVVKVDYKDRNIFREKEIPVAERFSIYNEKADFYWISLDELKKIIRSGSDILPNSPNHGKLYDKFHETLKKQLMDDSVDVYFIK